MTQPTAAEMIELPKVELQALFDLAVESMNFSSGFWDTEETNAARAIAVRLGLDPIVATPSNMAIQYGHAFNPWNFNPASCQHCNRPADSNPHLAAVTS